MHGKFHRFAFSILAAGVGVLTSLSGCSGSGGDSVVAQGNYSVVFAKRSATEAGNPTDSIHFHAGGDLMMVDLASPSSPPVNLTSSYTQGKGDVSDPEISYDGTKALFAMHGPNDVTWHIFEMNLKNRKLTRIIPDDATANLGNDVGPAYLPDGRIVFTSDRQETVKTMLAAENTQPYTYLDEYDREQSTVLHVMDANGSNIHQISFNQSHDRNPTVMMNGKIMFARWDHLGGRNHFPIFTVNPDGTDLFIEYGAFSPGNSFLHPREMPNGMVMSDLMPLSGTNEGGALMGIDVLNFIDNSEPIALGIPGNGQNELTLDQVNYETRDGLATYGRYTTPFPLWDGTNRALVSWSPSRPTTQKDPLSGQQETVEGNPQYGIYMFDLDKKTLRPVALPPDGWDYVDPVAVMSRPVPNIIPDQPVDANLAAQGLAVIDVKSVYDTDGQDLMGVSMLVPSEVANNEIPQTAPPPGDTRPSVADIGKIKDPAQTTAALRPGRFLRVIKAVPTPEGLSREAIGETEFEMQQILGYVNVEPDGSARIVVPANTSLALAVVDSNGMAIQTHTSWLQLRPGETRTCNGCHSPRRGVALNEAPLAGTNPNTWPALAPEPGESMAETLTRLNPSTVDGLTIDAFALQDDMVYTDVWTDPALAGRPADPPLSITYAGLTTPAPSVITYPPNSATPTFKFHVTNYPDNVAPIFTADRGNNTCTKCHNNTNVADPVSMGIDLQSTVAGTGRFQSYESLTVGPVSFDSNGDPIVTETDDGVMLQRGPAQVNIGSSSQSSRTSQLFENLLEKQLRSGTPLPPVHAVDHSTMLNSSELRVLAEWADLGAQYYNDPFNVAPGQHRSLSNLRGVSGLSQDTYNSQIHPILMSTCAGCHQAFGGDGTSTNPPNTSFSQNQFVLTGDLDGDYDVTLTMITNVCTPDQNPLLLRPTYSPKNLLDAAYPHPQIGTPPHAVLLATDPNYLTILNWIASGDSSNCS